MGTGTLPIVWIAGQVYPRETFKALARAEVRERLGDGRTYAVECPRHGARQMHSADGVRAFLFNHSPLRESAEG